MSEIPDFSEIASSYAASRPTYPPELFAWLASVVSRRELAWDTATGNGQAAVGLAAHFDRVIATDVSEAQLLHARRHSRVVYRVGRAEASGLSAASVDLVTAAAAVHWFDLPRFYDEVRRVVRSGGAVAVWSYHAGRVEPPLDAVLWPFYRDVVGPYFPAGARMVDDRYRGVSLPGRALEPPPFVISVTWTASQIVRYINTWSGVRAYREATGEDPVAALEPALAKVWGPPDAAREVRWPLYLRASRL